MPATNSGDIARPMAAFRRRLRPASVGVRRRTLSRGRFSCQSRQDGEPFEYRNEHLEFNVCCPDRTFPPGTYTWRYRGVDEKGTATNWSRTQDVHDSRGCRADAHACAGGTVRADPDSRIPGCLFVPEDLPRLRELAQGPMQDRYRAARGSLRQAVGQSAADGRTARSTRPT